VVVGEIFRGGAICFSKLSPWVPGFLYIATSSSKYKLIDHLQEVHDTQTFLTCLHASNSRAPRDQRPCCYPYRRDQPRSVPPYS
jgi:hypothetical protein